MAEGKIWANLLHLSYNMWGDRDSGRSHHLVAQPHLRFDEKLWNDLLHRMADAGMNMVVVDVGDGIQFESRPEISVEGAWSRAKLQSELAKMRDLGLEPIPKLNFSTAHDIWLKEYSRMVSTRKYYEVVGDLIRETIEAFENPRLLHLGMDEETAGHQKGYLYAVMRQHELWWHDLYFMVDAVEKAGARAWVWSDYIWHHPDEFVQKMPKSVLQSNWYYGAGFENFAEGDPQKTYVQAYDLLEEHGYDQLPTGSNWSTPGNVPGTVEYCMQRIAPERLKGFMTAPWHITLEEFRAEHEAAIDEIAETMKR